MSQAHPSIERGDFTSRDDYLQLNRKIDEIDGIIKKVSKKLLNNGREKLDQWRDESHQMIDRFYEQKCQELEESSFRKISKPKKEVDQIRLQISQLIEERKTNENDIQLLTSNIQRIKQSLKQIEEKETEINIQSLSIGENVISIEKSISANFDLSILKSPCHRIHSSNEKSWSIASNKKYLLIDQYPNLYLLDQNLTIVNQYRWKYNHISDICWSAILNKFLIITSNTISLIDQNFQSIEHIRSIKGEKWWSCTCSNSSLYLTSNQRDTTIFQFDIFPPFQLIREWKSSNSADQNEYISDITYQNEKLALIIVQFPNRTVDLILRSSITFDLLWSYQLDINYKWFQTAIRCSSLTNDQWIILEEYTSHLFHIDQHGQMKGKCQYSFQPCNAILFGTDLLAIRTETTVNFHQL